MKKNNDGQFGAGNPFSNDTDFVQDLTKTNPESHEHLVISGAEKMTTKVIPGGGGGMNGNGQTEPNTISLGWVHQGGDGTDKQCYVSPSDRKSPPTVSDKKLAPIQTAIHIAVFARYQRPEGEQLIKDVGYLHVASGINFHLVLAGYLQTKPRDSEFGALSAPKEIKLRPDLIWFYDDNEFFENVQMVEEASTWKYGGGLQLLICDVKIEDGQPANIRQMFLENKALLENVILIDVDEIKKNELFADFDRFFEALRTIIFEIDSCSSSSGPNSDSGLTWQLSDRLGLKKGADVTKRALAKAFKLEFFEAINTAIILKGFAVKDIRRNPASN